MIVLSVASTLCVSTYARRGRCYFSPFASLRNSALASSSAPMRRRSQSRARAVKPFGARILARGNAAVAREHGLKERTLVTDGKGDCRLRQRRIHGSLESTRRRRGARFSDR